MDSQLDPDTLGLGTAGEDFAQGQSDATLLRQVQAGHRFQLWTTAQTSVNVHLQAMINEKVAPEILAYDPPLVAGIEAQIEHQVCSAWKLLLRYTSDLR